MSLGDRDKCECGHLRMSHEGLTNGRGETADGCGVCKKCEWCREFTPVREWWIAQGLQPPQGR